jgi:hypothetical protein
MIETSTGKSGQILCHFCNSAATCLGRYEDSKGSYKYSCDACCGHGNEDGKCKSLTSDDFKSFYEAVKREA